MAKKKKGSALKKVGVGVFVVALAGGGALYAASTQHVPKVVEKTVIGDVDLSGMTREAAAKAVSEWYSRKKVKPIVLVSDELTKNPDNLTAESLGVELDVKATMAKMKVDNFWTQWEKMVNSSAAPSRTVLEPVYKFTDEKFADLAVFVTDNAKPNQKARVRFAGGSIQRTPEIAGVELNPKEMPSLVTRLMTEGGEGEIPLEPAPKHVPDSELEKITAVVAEYSTRFNAGQAARSYNVRRASEIIDGLILMPGETFKFNEYVGRRTTAGGFKTAGVYVNGRHDYDVGGGICQVSSTLYNAALLSDLKIKQRSNHSLPVPYVPLGRDATVSYPAPELAIQNNRDVPIALAAIYEPGRLTFKVLSSPDPGLEVKIEQGTATSWSNGVKYVHDGTLAYGVEKVVDKGGSGRKVSTVRVVYRDGVEVRRESLGTSTYRGGPKIVARNNNAKPPTAAPEGEVAPTPSGTQPAASGARTPRPGAASTAAAIR